MAFNVPNILKSLVYIKNKTNLLILFLLFTQVSNLFSMEKDCHVVIPQESNSVLSLGNLSPEVICCILKELLKIFIIDFISHSSIEVDQNIPIKKVRLINKFFKHIMHVHKRNLIRQATQELGIFGQDSLNQSTLNILFIKILKEDCELMQGKKVTLLFMMGLNPNLKVNWNFCNDEQKVEVDTLLIMISKSGKFKNLINVLCSFGINVNSIDENKGTPLIVATLHDQVEIVKLLLKKGADFNLKHNGFSALDIAQQQENEVIIDLFFPPSLIKKIFRILEGISEYMLVNHIA